LQALHAPNARLTSSDFRKARTGVDDFRYQWSRLRGLTAVHAATARALIRALRQVGNALRSAHLKIALSA
jgi:hypothetical protein